MHARRFVVVFAAACFTLLVRVDAARACSVCLAGDPNFSAQGSAAQETGSVSVYFEVRGWEKTSGKRVPAHEHGEVGAAGHAATGSSNEPEHEHEHEHAHQDEHEHEAEDGHIEHAESAATAHAPAHADAGEAEEDDRHDHEGRERNESKRLDLYFAWTPLDRVTLTLNLPWAINGIEEIEADGSEHFSLSDFGDAALGVSGVVWRNRDALPSTWVEARGWVKAPTGRDEQRVGGVEDPHLQAGTGSWDFGFGSAVVHRFEWGSLYGSGFYRVNTEGGLDYEFGDVVLATAALEVPLGHATGVPQLDRVTPGVGLDFRWADRDRQYGRDVDDTGGAILYATPSLRIALPAFSERQRAWLRAGVQVPLTNAWLYDEQEEDPVWSVGIGYGF
jgi:hypothetical protein